MAPLVPTCGYQIWNFSILPSCNAYEYKFSFLSSGDWIIQPQYIILYVNGFISYFLFILTEFVKKCRIDYYKILHKKQNIVILPIKKISSALQQFFFYFRHFFLQCDIILRASLKFFNSHHFYRLSRFHPYRQTGKSFKYKRNKVTLIWMIGLLKIYHLNLYY